MSFSIGKMLESFDRRFDIETLEEFQRHFESSVAGREKSLTSEYSSLSIDQFEDPEDLPNYQSHLADEFFCLDEVKKLGYELCIVALYKQIELHTKKVVKRNFPSVDEKVLSDFSKLKAALPFKLNKLKNYAAINELRLINNAIKHVGRVSKELAKCYSTWKAGEKLDRLDSALVRLSPLVQIYVDELVTSAYAHSIKYRKPTNS